VIGSRSNEKLQAPVTGKVPGSCQAWRAKDPNTLGSLIATLAAVWAEDPITWALTRNCVGASHFCWIWGLE
jgi:hypothetical protein